MGTIFRLCFVLSAVGPYVGGFQVNAQEKPSAAAGGATDRKWGDVVGGQALSVATEKSAFAPGERIVLNIRFNNVGKADVRATLDGTLDIYEVAVLLPDGKPAPQTLFAKNYYRRRSGSRSYPVLKPGRYYADTINIARLFDFSVNGKYVITAKRHVWKDGGFKDTATSNPLEIVIDDRGSPPTYEHLRGGQE